MTPTKQARAVLENLVEGAAEAIYERFIEGLTPLADATWSIRQARQEQARAALLSPHVVAAFAAMVEERDEARCMFKLKSEATRRFAPCSDHVGKVDNQKNGCPWCRIETLQGKTERASYALASLREEAAAVQRNLENRDNFLVSRGMWDAFIRWTKLLDASSAPPAAPDAKVTPRET